MKNYNSAKNKYQRFPAFQNMVYSNPFSWLANYDLSEAFVMNIN